MPCSDGGYTQEQLRQIEFQKIKHDREINLRTQIACAALTWIENNGYMINFKQSIDPNENGFEIKDLRNWWNNHKKEDEKRRRKEAKEKAIAEEKTKKLELKKKVLSELSDEQLEALGLKRI